MKLAITKDSVRKLVPLLIAMVALAVFGSTQSEHFLTTQNLNNMFQQIAVLGVLAVGQTILMIAGQLDLSVGSAVSLLSIVGAKLLAARASEGEVIVVALALGLALGLLIGLIVAVTRVQPFILTLGGLSVFAGIALILSNQQPISVGLAFVGLSLGNVVGLSAPAVVFIGLCLAGAMFLAFTTPGRNAYAVGSNAEAAYLAGVSIAGVKILLYGINGILVGLASVMLLARVGSGDPNGGVGLELQVITAVVLGGATLSGGRGTMLGTFLAVFLLGLISNTLNIVGVPNSYERLVFGGVLIMAVVYSALDDLRRSSDIPLGRQLARMLIRR
jgi:ribose/xylose/arabinose/galactoside ABC-type transport system permease subunit